MERPAVLGRVVWGLTQVWGSVLCFDPLVFSLTLGAFGIG